MGGLCVTDPFAQAYDPEAFRRTGHAVVDRLGQHLQRALSAQEGAPLHALSPEALHERWPGQIPEEGLGDPVERIGELLPYAHHLHHPGYVGHQVAPPLPAASLVEMVTALLNNGMAIYEMGPTHVLCERRVVAFLNEQIGWGADSDGILTHGGSLGNLTALLAARQAKAGFDVWKQGSEVPLAFLASAQNHYCIDRAVRLMGWGAGGVETVEVDGRYRLDPDRLEAALQRARDRGRKVLGVVASDCTTSTGSFDPIDAIADFCEANDLWLHVDGAHGASFLLHEPSRRDLLRGIERADSVVWDLHKMMLMPALITGVLFRESRRSYEAFAQEASYLFQAADPESQWFNVGQRTLECTKRGLGATAYTLLRIYGVGFFREYLDRMLRLTRSFVQMLQQREEFALAIEPQANIVCFRYLAPGSVAEQNALQERLRQKMVQEGNFYLVQTELDGVLWLRTTLIHPMTDVDGLRRLLDDLVDIARRLP